MTLPYVTIPDAQLTANFTLYEFLRSDMAEHFGIDNTPDQTALKRIAELAVFMQAVRDHLGHVWTEEVFIDITSGYRSPELNAVVGGSETSDHLTGWACDWTARTWRGGLREVHVARAVSASVLEFDQLIYYPPADRGGERLHLGIREPGRQRREVLTKAIGPGYHNGIVG